jgi:thiamine pyrophosphate-dependent acetolactate synthase large subunit-like protein
VAEGLGAYAEQVRTPDQVAPAIRRALQANQNGQNAVLEMLTKEEGAVPKYWQG